LDSTTFTIFIEKSHVLDGDVLAIVIVFLIYYVIGIILWIWFICIVYKCYKYFRLNDSISSGGQAISYDNEQGVVIGNGQTKTVTNTSVPMLIQPVQ
jgi:hypothetical protein